MSKIFELLDEYANLTFQHGMDVGLGDFDAVVDTLSARSAVDAEIKRMQDRIAELEYENIKMTITGKSDALLLYRYHRWCEDNGCAPSTLDLYSVILPPVLENLNKEVMHSGTS